MPLLQNQTTYIAVRWGTGQQRQDLNCSWCKITQSVSFSIFTKKRKKCSHSGMKALWDTLRFSHTIKRCYSCLRGLATITEVRNEAMAWIWKLKTSWLSGFFQPCTSMTLSSLALWDSQILEALWLFPIWLCMSAYTLQNFGRYGH